MIKTLLIIAIVLLAFYFVVRMLQRRTKATKLAQRYTGPRVDPLAPDRTITGDPRFMKIGDSIEINGAVSYVVRGILRMKSDGFSWVAYFTKGTNGEDAWIEVEADPDVEVTIWHGVLAGELSEFEHTAMRGVYDNVVYTLDERGSATYTSEGTTGLEGSGTVKYHDFEGADGSSFSFEEYGDFMEASIGREVVLYEVHTGLSPIN